MARKPSNPLCVECERQGRTVAATVVDHITPHRGNTFLFWSVNDWQSITLCALSQLMESTD